MTNDLRDALDTLYKATQQAIDELRSGAQERAIDILSRALYDVEHNAETKA